MGKLNVETDKNHNRIFDPLKGIILIVIQTVNIIIRSDLKCDLGSDFRCVYTSSACLH